MKTVTVGEITIGRGHPLVLISGPCVVESAAVMEQTAAALVEMCGELGLPLVFKSSFEKDNRTAATAHRGPGLEEGLAALSELRSRHGFPLLSDVHRPSQMAAAARTLDMVQIPAFLCRQTSLLEAAGACGVAVNIKKGQFMSPDAMEGSVDKVLRAGGAGVLLTERGSSFGPGRLVCDMAGIPQLRALGHPVAMDAGHAANHRDAIPTLALSGVAAGADALYIECHPEPHRALCDGTRMLSLGEIRRLLEDVVRLGRVVREDL